MRVFTDKYLSEIENQPKSTKHIHHNKYNYVEDIRKSRSDVLAHYPFADNSGTVTEILTHSNYNTENEG